MPAVESADRSCGSRARVCAPRLSWPAPGRSWRSAHQRVRISREPVKALGGAFDDRRAATEAARWRRSDGRVSVPPPAVWSFRRGRWGGLLQAPGRRAAAEHEALAQRVRGQPVGAMKPGAGALPDRVQARDGRAPIEVGDDPAHHVVRGRRHRHQLAASGRCPPRAAPRRRSGTAPGRSRACPGRPSRCRFRMHQRLDRPGDLVAGGELIDEALAVRVVQRAPSPRIASVTGSPRAPGMPITAVG